MGFSDNNLAAFAKYFGETATVNGVAVSGVFENGYAETLEVAGSEPMLTCRISEVPNAQQGQAVTVPGRGFVGTIANPEPDGNGFVVLVLHQGG